MAKAASLYEQQRYTEAGLQLESALRSDPDNPRVHRELARALRAAGSAERCRTQLEKAVELNPDDLVLQYLLGAVSEDDGEAQQAILHLRVALRCSNAGSVPDFRALVLFRLAELLRSEGYLTASLEAYRRYQDAVAELGSEVEVDPELATLLQINRGQAGRPMSMAYEQLGKFGLAADTLAGALREGTPDPADRKRLVRLWSQAGRHEQAVAEAREIVAQDRSAVDLLLETHRLAGHPGRAADDLAALLASSPDDSRLLFAYVETLQKLERGGEAEAQLRRFAQAHPRQLEVRWRLFESCAAREAWAEALAVAAEVIRTTADEATAARWRIADLPPAAAEALLGLGATDAFGRQDYAVWYLLGCLALESDRLEQADSWLRRVADQAPEFIPASVELASLHNRQYRWEECLAELASRGDEPGDARVEWLRGQACAGLDRNEQAVIHFSAAIRLNRSDTRSMKALADLYERTGRPLQAVRQYRSVLAVNPLDAEVREQLISLYIRNGNREEAVTQLQTLGEQAASPNRVARCRAFLEHSAAVPDLDRFREALTEGMAVAGRDPLSLTYIAITYFDQARFDEALATISEAVELDADDPDTLVALEYAYRMTLQFEKSADVLRGLLQRYPNRKRWLEGLVDVLVTVQAYDRALAVLSSRLDRPDLDDADRRRYRLDVLNVLASAGRFDERIDLLQNWHSESPQDADLREQLVNAYLAADRDGDVLPLVEQWYEAEPTSPDLLGAYADLLVRTGQGEGAFQLMLGWIENDPDNDRLQLLLIALLRDAERYDDALELAANCLLDARHALPFEHQRFLTHAAAGRHEEAIGVLSDLIYQRVNEAQFDSHFYRRLLAEQLILADRTDEAINRLKRWIEQSFDPEAQLKYLRLLAGSFQERGRLRQAIETLERAYDLNPRDAWVNNDLGYNWADAGVHLDESEKRLRYAVSQEPRNGAFLDSLGWVLYKKGDFAGAIEWLTRAAAAGDPDPVIVDHLGDALWRAGRGAEAVEHWSNARLLAEQRTTDEERVARAEDRAILDSAAQKVALGEDGGEPQVAVLGTSVESGGDGDEGGPSATGD